MKSLIFAAALLGAALPATAQVSVSIQLGMPDFYGRIDLGDFREPPVYYAQPMIIERHVRVAEPLYLRVPPGHMKKWSKHCGRYNACGRRVFFVRDDWYSNTYAPRYREMHGGGGGGGHHGKAARHEMKHEMKHDKHHDKHHDKGHDKGHGNGHGNGKGNGKGKD